MRFGLLDSPRLYLLSQFLVGGLRARARCLDDHVPRRANLRVLDVGCGPGYVVKQLTGCHYIGLDLDRGYIDYARRRYGHLGEFHCELLTERFVREHPPFDLALLNGVLHHLEDAAAVDLLQLIRSALAADGRLLTLDGFHRAQHPPLTRALLALDRGRFIRTVPAYRELAGRVFRRVLAHDHPDYFHLPYPVLVLECSDGELRP